MEEGELDVVASETGFGEDATHYRVVEDRENEVFEFDFEQRRRLLLLLHHCLLPILPKLSIFGIAVLDNPPSSL